MLKEMSHEVELFTYLMPLLYCLMIRCIIYRSPRGSLINFSFAHLSYRCIAWPLHSSRRHSAALCDSFSLKSWHQISPRYCYPAIKLSLMPHDTEASENNPESSQLGSIRHMCTNSAYQASLMSV